MAERVNQHYVPQFYFRHFSVNCNTVGMILVRDGRTFTRAPIKGQCSRKNFYGSKELESLFGELESQHCVAIRAALEVSNKATAEFFSFEELCDFFDAIAFQRARTATEVAKIAPALEKMHLYMFRRHLELTQDEAFLKTYDENVAAGKITVTESTASAVGRGVSTMLENARLIRDLSFCFIRNRTDYPFVFSDSPVVLYNTYAKAVKNRGVLGLQCPGLQIFYPLDSWTCVMLFDPKTYHGPFRGYLQYDAHQRSDISQLNALQMHHALNAVYFGDPAHEDYVYQLWRTHRSDLSTPAAECRINPDLWVDGKPAQDDLLQMMEPQLNFDLNLSFVECEPVSQADYAYKPRSPDLVELVKSQYVKRDRRKRDSNQ
jgi:hypothetical protein